MRPQLKAARRHLARMWPAYLVLAIALSPFPFIYYRLSHYTDELRQSVFRDGMSAVQGRMNLHFTHHIALLTGLRGFLSAQNEVTADEFQRYMEGLDLHQPTTIGAPRLPGLLDIGFAPRVPHAEREKHVLQVRRGGYPSYDAQFQGEGPDHFPILYLDDLGQDDVVAPGWDVSGDTNRFVALLKARDSGDAVATGTTPQHRRAPAPDVPGFTLYLPVYQGGVTPPTVEERRSRFVGVVFASFEHARFWRYMEWEGDDRNHQVVDLAVFDDQDFTPARARYPAPDAPIFTRKSDLMDGYTADGLGRTWGFFFASRPNFDQRGDRHLPSVTLAGGVTLGLALFGVAWALVKARLRADRVTEELRDSEAQFRGIFDAIPDLFFRSSIEGRLLLISPSCRTLFGYDSDRLRGSESSAFFANEAEYAEARRLLLAKGQVHDLEVTLRHQDGRPIPCSLSARVILDSAGRPVASEGILRDISLRKQTEDARLRASKLESIGILAGGIAHDFNNLLATILSNASLARLSGPMPSVVSSTLDEVESAVGRARELTHQLLTFARGGSPIRTPLLPTPLIRESARFATRGSRIVCDFDLARDLWPIEADAGQISQVLHNIVLNAAQAMPNGGHVRLRARNVTLPEGADDSLPPGPYLHVTIADDGPGIPPENLSKIFDPYFTTKTLGSGLGLATSYSIVTRHAGRLSAESIPGSGATFHVWLPASPHAVLPTPPPTSPLRAGSERILILDDEGPLRTVLVRMLERLGYRAEGYPDGETALAAQRRALEAGQPFDAAILDLTIPDGMGGLEALQHLRALQPDLRAIVSSGYSEDPVMADHRGHGFDGLLSKPYRTESLARILGEVLDRVAQRSTSAYPPTTSPEPCHEPPASTVPNTWNSRTN